jgi:uncharacterized protein (PEP-CTERM system associated)
MAATAAPFRTAARRLGAALAILAAHSAGAAAFPLLDPTNQDTLPGAVSNLAPPDAQDLRHQLQLTNGFAAPAGGGWTILPRIDIEEVFNDNVQQVSRPRRWDLQTVISPGVSVIGDLPRLQLKFDYAPAIELNVPEGSQNALVQQLNGTALVTVVPELAFVDLHAFAGSQALNGLTGANGAAGNIGQAGAGSAIAPGSTTVGLAKQNRTQTSSFSVSPYLLHTFGDTGTGKLGVSLTSSSNDQTTGFAALPFPTSGTLGSSLLRTEQTGQFTTGSFLNAWQDTASFDLSQSRTDTNQVVSATGQTATIPRTTISSTRAIVSDRLTYAVNHWASVFATFGHEDIAYSNAAFRRIDDITWSLGTDLQPNPDSQLSLSYGHQNGFDSFQANGRYALTARTVLSGSYNETLGTQLEQIGALVDEGVIGPDGQFVNGANGTPLQIPVFLAETVPSVFRYRTVNLSLTTVLDRDMVSLNAVLSQQSTVAAATQHLGSGRSFVLQWRHELSPDLSFTSYASYTTQTQAGSQLCPGSLSLACPSGAPGSTRSLVFGASLNYLLTETLSAHLRYVFNDRSAAVANGSMVQDLLVLGITKQF